MAEILLVHPRENARIFGGMPPLGLAWIASFLEARDYKVEMVDMQISDKPFEEILKKCNPKIVGISGTSHTRFESFEIAKEAKKYNKDIFVIYGGSHATFTAEDTLKNIPQIDLIVRGEGELSVLQIVENILRRKNHDFTRIEGISYRENGTLIHKGPAARIENMDILPIPKRNPDELKKYNLSMDFLNIPGASVMSSRGCPVNCSYCSASAMFGTKLTLRDPKNVIDEIEMLLSDDYGVKGIKFFDSTLTLNRTHVEGICHEITRRRLRFPWECEIRVNTVTKDLLKTMKDAGCYYVNFGVESASPRILKEMHKAITTEQVQNVFKWTKELGILTKVFFTFGHIKEKPEDAKITMDFIAKHKSYITSHGGGVGIKIYPGTKVAQYAYDTGCLPANFSWTTPYHDEKAAFFGGAPHIPLLIQPQMGYAELQQIRYQFIKNKMRNPISIVKGINDAWKKNNIQKVWTVTKGMLQARFNS